MDKVFLLLFVHKKKNLLLSVLLTYITIQHSKKTPTSPQKSLASVSYVC